MATFQENAMWVLWFFETKLVIKGSFVTELSMEKINLHKTLSGGG
jgi:hypothetical protein